MAKKSMVARENKRLKLSAKFQRKRECLKKQIKNNNSFEEVMDAENKLQKLPRDSMRVRATKRCLQCGRPHGVYKKFGLCRICLRTQLMLGNVPGGKKASW